MVGFRSNHGGWISRLSCGPHRVGAVIAGAGSPIHAASLHVPRARMDAGVASLEFDVQFLDFIGLGLCGCDPFYHGW
jgi:hypothetical protein